MKNIVVCSDGTGNTAIKGRGTNVFKLFEAVDLTGHRAGPGLTPQIALYDDGVGTQNFKPLMIFAGTTGWGLSRNVKQLYKEIVRVYDEGDQLFLFGFSRGAFTVRTLAGFITTCGLLEPRKLTTARALHDAVAKAYRAYRQHYRTWLGEKLHQLGQTVLRKPRNDARAAFKQEWARAEDTRIRFIGVWDTVDAVGLPFHLGDILNKVVYRFKFPDRHLSSLVDHACHALAIDDERHSFHPLLWDETREANGRLEQVWFAGAHSNVGGGYPKQGVSLVALDWMMAAAEGAGLRFHADDRRFYREHANVDDKLYDPRAGLGVFYRWKQRDLVNLCEKNGVQPRVHASVLERVAHGTDDYTPGNLHPKATVVVTPPPKDDEGLLQTRAENMQVVLRTAHAHTAADASSLLACVPGARRIGWLSYYVYLVACTAALIGGAQPKGLAASLGDPLGLLIAVGRTLWGFASSPFDTAITVGGRIASDPVLLACLVGGLGAAYAMAFVADRRMSAVFSQFWHRAQPELRKALKAARRAVSTSDRAA